MIKGFSQPEGIDYDEIFAPVGKQNSLCILLHIAALFDWDIEQGDIITAFLLSMMEEGIDIYMEQPEGYKDPNHPDHVYHIKKALYGLKQSPRLWNQQC